MPHVNVKGVKNINDVTATSAVTGSENMLVQSTGGGTKRLSLTTLLAHIINNLPIASSSNLGTVKVNGNGLTVTSAGQVNLTPANATQVKGGASAWLPIVPSVQDSAAFYGLAKAAGDSTQSASSNAVGSYTDEAKTAIKAMIGVTDPDLSNYVQKTDYADIDNAGVVKINPSFGIGIYDGSLLINGASASDIKSGNNSTKAVSAYRQHESTFYGLAKAAGVDMKNSDNAVGTYTSEAKTAIQNMIGINNISIDSTLTQSGQAADAQAVGNALNLHFTGFDKDSNDILCFSSYCLEHAESEVF